MKKVFALFVAGLCFIIFVIARLLLSANGVISYGSLKGFAVDSEENIYIGTPKKIEVYKNGRKIRIINPSTSRDYCFYIEEDELIIAHASDYSSYVFDLYGNYISEGNDNYTVVDGKAERRKSMVQNGNQYELKEYFGFKPYAVLCNGEIVYRQSTIDFCFYGLQFWIFFLIEFACIGGLILAVVTDEKCRQFFKWM